MTPPHPALGPSGTLPPSATLLVIDVQQAFDHPGWGRRNNPGAEAEVSRLLAGWRASNRPVIHIRHRNLQAGRRFSPGEPGSRAKPEAAEGRDELVLFKHVNSAFIGTDLESLLRKAGSSTLVLVGLTTDHCVSTTARMGGNLGFEVLVVADATATFERVGPDGRKWTAEEMHDTALASLHEEFASIVSVAGVLDALA